MYPGSFSVAIVENVNFLFFYMSVPKLLFNMISCVNVETRVENVKPSMNWARAKSLILNPSSKTKTESSRTSGLIPHSLHHFERNESAEINKKGFFRVFFKRDL